MSRVDDLCTQTRKSWKYSSSCQPFEQGALFCKKRTNLRNFLRHFSFNIVLIENYSRILHKQFDPFEDRHKNIFLNRKRFGSWISSSIKYPTAWALVWLSDHSDLMFHKHWQIIQKITTILPKMCCKIKMEIVIILEDYSNIGWITT